MKKRDLEKELAKEGYVMKRNGGNHDVWSNGKTIVIVPRHAEINEYTAKAILKKARDGK